MEADIDSLAARLIESEQQLAAMPELERKLERTGNENAALRAELESTRAALDDILTSPSWRLTAPLRRLRAFARRSR